MVAAESQVGLPSMPRWLLMELENLPPSCVPWLGTRPSPLLPSRVIRALYIDTSEPAPPFAW